jgi:RNA polymerase sigma-70 factor (ECF subfamily)
VSDSDSDTTASMQLARDSRLAKRMLRGEERAVKEFCDEYLPKLYRYTIQRVRNEADVSDIVQVVLTNAARRIETFRGEATLLTWLVQICRREISKHVVDAKRRDLFVPFLHDEALKAVVESLEAPDSGEPEAVGRRNELIGLVQLALDQLPERYARALELKYIEGFSSKEIAHRLGIGDEATQSLLARARRAFREVCGEALIATYQTSHRA